MYKKNTHKNSMIFCVCLLVLAEFLTIFLMYKSSNNKTTNLDDVNLKDNIVTNNMFAIMIEQDDGTYDESDSSSWPTNYEYNEELSGCVDLNGNRIDGILKYDAVNNIATVDTDNTIFCYLYFSKPQQ